MINCIVETTLYGLFPRSRMRKSSMQEREHPYGRQISNEQPQFMDVPKAKSWTMEKVKLLHDFCSMTPWVGGFGFKGSERTF